MPTMVALTLMAATMIFNYNDELHYHVGGAHAGNVEDAAGDVDGVYHHMINITVCDYGDMDG